jgi:hypothetical protein
VKTNYTTDGQNKAHHYRRRRKRLKKWRKSGRPAAAATPNNKFRQELSALQVNVPATQNEGSSAVNAKNKEQAHSNGDDPSPKKARFAPRLDQHHVPREADGQQLPAHA